MGQPTHNRAAAARAAAKQDREELRTALGEELRGYVSRGLTGRADAVRTQLAALDDADNQPDTEPGPDLDAIAPALVKILKDAGLLEDDEDDEELVSLEVTIDPPTGELVDEGAVTTTAPTETPEPEATEPATARRGRGRAAAKAAEAPAEVDPSATA